MNQLKEVLFASTDHYSGEADASFQDVAKLFSHVGSSD